jgi:hypothetical protein
MFMSIEHTERWHGWIDGPIRKNVLTMHLQRDSYIKVTRILAANKSLPDSYWWEFMVDTYITTQAIAVRRQADLDGRVASLARLISEIRNKPGAITREYWIGQWRDDLFDGEWIQREAERGWAEQYAGDVGDYLDPSIPAADLAALRDGSGKVKRFVDQHIAHSEDMIHQPDPEQPADVEAAATGATLSAKEVHEVVDLIGEQFTKYYNLLTASTYVRLVPVIQHEWLAAFRVPWMPPDYTPED